MSDVETGQRPCTCGCGGVMIPHEDGCWLCLTALLAEDDDDGVFEVQDQLPSPPAACGGVA